MHYMLLNVHNENSFCTERVMLMQKVILQYLLLNDQVRIYCQIFTGSSAEL